MINDTERENTPTTDLLEDELWTIDKTAESIIKNENFRQQLLDTVSEQLTTLKQGNEIHQFNGMNTLRLKHLSTIIENETFFAPPTWIYIATAISLGTHAIIISLGIIKIRQLTAKLTGLNKRMNEHENEIEIEGTELERLRAITVINEDRACANKGN